MLMVLDAVSGNFFTFNEKIQLLNEVIIRMRELNYGLPLHVIKIQKDIFCLETESRVCTNPMHRARLVYAHDLKIDEIITTLCDIRHEQNQVNRIVQNLVNQQNR